MSNNDNDNKKSNAKKEKLAQSNNLLNYFQVKPLQCKKEIQQKLNQDEQNTKAQFLEKFRNEQLDSQKQKPKDKKQSTDQSNLMDIEQYNFTPKQKKPSKIFKRLKHRNNTHEEESFVESKKKQRIQDGIDDAKSGSSEDKMHKQLQKKQQTHKNQQQQINKTANYDEMCGDSIENEVQLTESPLKLEEPAFYNTKLVKQSKNLKIIPSPTKIVVEDADKVSFSSAATIECSDIDEDIADALNNINIKGNKSASKSPMRNQQQQQQQQQIQQQKQQQKDALADEQKKQQFLIPKYQEGEELSQKKEKDGLDCNKGNYFHRIVKEKESNQKINYKQQIIEGPDLSTMNHQKNDYKPLHSHTNAAMHNIKNVVSPKKESTLQSASLPKAQPKEQQKEQNQQLAGIDFVITGEFGGVKREDIEDIVKFLGGKCPKAVSKKTNFLLTGDLLQDGRAVNLSTKYEKAQKIGTKILTQNDFEDYLLKKTGRNLEQWQYFKEHKKDPSLEIEHEDDINSNNKLQMQTKQDVRPNQNTNQKQMVESQLWTHKFAPDSIKSIIGHQSDIKKISEWLDSWQDVVLRGHKKPIQPGRGGNWQNAVNVNARACLVSGPPGIGKTTAIRILAKEKGYQLIEQNASDVRNKLGLQNMMGHLTDNQLITTNNAIKNRKFLILMDECDGMSSGDRGGNAQLIQLIKTAKTPIICICNDRQNPKMRTLANHCYDIRFAKPNKQSVAKRMVQIAQQEGLQTDINTIELLCEQMGNDLRQILNFLQMRRRTHSDLDFIQAKKGLGTKDHEVQMGPFDAVATFCTRSLFSKLDFTQKMDYFFIDYNLIPLLIQENIWGTFVYDNKQNAVQQMQTWDKVCTAADSFACSDLTNKSIQTSQNYALLPMLGFQGVLYPTQLVSQYFHGFPKFPEFLGKYSATKKVNRLVNELRFKLAHHITGNKMDVKMCYAPLLIKALLGILERNDVNCVYEAMDFMELYDLNPDFLKEHLVEVQFNPKKLDLLAKVQPKTKVALTKAYNKRHLDSLKGVKVNKKNAALPVGESFIEYDEFNEGQESKQLMVDAELSDDQAEGREEEDEEQDKKKIQLPKAKPKPKAKAAKKPKKE